MSGFDSLLRQHFLNFFPLPHGQGSFLPVTWFTYQFNVADKRNFPATAAKT